MGMAVAWTGPLSSSSPVERWEKDPGLTNNPEVPCMRTDYVVKLQ